MENLLLGLTVSMLVLPLLGAIVAGFLGHYIGQNATHRVAITLVGVAFLIACYVWKIMVIDDFPAIDHFLYMWATAANLKFEVGILIDRLSITMSLIVLFVSFMVHIYTIGYMKGDPGYNRFFSYVSLFTFMMLLLVLANNFLVLFTGWEGVGLVSYLLIGFWYNREKAAFGSLKAFIVNRIGDVAFILALAGILKYFSSLNYDEVFQQIPEIINENFNLFPTVSVSVMTVLCILLFIGAMAKSAQVPMHVWLPESMEGPTPISALIHAATMVTAGIYMVARMSPMFEFSETTLSLILILGGTTAFFMGLVALTQHDIKRVIAYSTISQLGYMAVALGASAYDIAIFHLITHAFFKALLFLAAGSVIIALHHEQDMRKMGGLARRMPITYLTFVAGALALSAIPPFSGFFSKDLIIDVVKLCELPGAKYAYYCVLAGAFVTPLYIFRALFLTFHGNGRMDHELQTHVKESSWVVWMPLILLAIPSIIIGHLLVTPMVFDTPNLLGKSVFVLPSHHAMAELVSEYKGTVNMALTAGSNLSFWLAIAGIITAWLVVAMYPNWSLVLKRKFSFIHMILAHKYGFDDFNQIVFVRGTQELGHLFYEVSDVKLIDHLAVNGSGRLIRWFAQASRLLQTGYIYHYALAMILGTLVFLAWFSTPVMKAFQREAQVQTYLKNELREHTHV